ncbi:GntR family transcriptional regulator [Marinobacterium lacunae]|nr:GntR family transcriptional regulator [Marinobacterium lacunae]
MNKTDKSSVVESGKHSSAPSAVPMRQAAYERIEALLNSGALRPGQMVTQRELVEMTGSTLGSVREAVPRFEAEGLLQTVPKRGLMVPSLDVLFVREAYQMRQMIEVSAVDDMVRSMNRKTVEEMIDWHKQVLSKIEAGEAQAQEVAQAIQQYDWAMHEAFVASMHNSLIANVYRVTAIKIRMAVQSRIQITSFNALRVIREHLAILDALASGDAGATRKALTHHLNNSLTLALGGRVD